MKHDYEVVKSVVTDYNEELQRDARNALAVTKYELELDWAELKAGYEAADQKIQKAVKSEYEKAQAAFEDARSKALELRKKSEENLAVFQAQLMTELDETRQKFASVQEKLS